MGVFLCDRKFLSHKTLREDAHLAEMKYMLRIPLERKRVASDSLLGENNDIYTGNHIYQRIT